MDYVYQKNEAGRDFVIGDLHGCYQIFLDTLDSIDFDKTKDRMFSVGDLIDRGPSSIECLRLLKEPWFFSVMGNHEDLMVRHIVHGEEPFCWDQNGGLWHYKADQEELTELARTASALPLSITVETAIGNVGICHAQPPSSDWKDAIRPTDKHSLIMLWARRLVYQEYADDINNIDLTIHGHTPTDEPISVGNSLFIDTGAFFSGVLTCKQL